MAAMQTTIISANITAYSTAVGPSSCLRKRIVLIASVLSIFILLGSGSHIGLRWQTDRLITDEEEWCLCPLTNNRVRLTDEQSRIAE